MDADHIANLLEALNDGTLPDSERPEVDDAIAVLRDNPLTAFRDEVCVRANDIDPDDSLDWYSVSIGFFLARGVEIGMARALALKARHEHMYWPNG